MELQRRRILMIFGHFVFGKMGEKTVSKRVIHTLIKALSVDIGKTMN